MPPSFPSSPGNDAFRSYPQKYPKAQSSAARSVGALYKLIQKGPHSMVATVVDTSFHASQGYVLCTTGHVVVRVYGVPYATVVPQMRLYCRQIGILTTNQSFVFDGYAPNLSGLGLQGSVLMTSVPQGGATLVCSSNASPATVGTSSLTTATGYYWHCFFYVPQLPTSTVTLFQFLQYVGGSNTVQLEYLPSGKLQFRSQDNKGYVTNSTIAPHNAHWVVIQPGLTSSELLVDGVASYSALPAGGLPTFVGGTNTFCIAYLTTNTGSQPCPVGSWVSKMGYGMNYSSGAPVALPTSIPVYDSQLTNLNVSVTQKTENLYLCEDGPTSTTLANAGQYNVGGNLTLVTTYAQAQQNGPY